MALLIIAGAAGVCSISGLSTDEKPAPSSTFTFYETDTGRNYNANGTSWVQVMDASYLASAASSTYARVSSYVYQAQIGTAASTASSTYALNSALGTAASTAAANYASSTHRHDASHITSGTMLQARLGGGVADATTFLRGDQTYAVPGGGSDPWTYLRVTSDVWVSTSASTVAIPGLAFTPAVSTRYEIEAQMKFRTSTAGTGPRPALVWPTNAIGGVATLWLTSAVGTQLLTNGNIASTTIQIPVGGLPDTTGWWPGQLMASYQSSSNTSGNILIRMGSETSSTWVGIQRDSFMKYRTYT